jgi:hypothetical protein
LAYATSGVCDGVPVRDLKADQWIASNLQYWTGVQANAKTYLTLCLSELRSSRDAETNVGQLAGDLGVGAPASASNDSLITVSAIPGSIGATTRNGLVRLAFSKSHFVVFVAAGGTSGVGAASLTTLATNLAEAEYQKLPI